ncbi:E3 ubiquitin-protein ligase TRAIP-like [Argonauta hians]
MNAYCVICSDRFVSTCGEWDIAAGTCGHTFHSACLHTWLETSRTCPTCRKRWSKKDAVIKLYFDLDNVPLETEEAAAPRLLNELNSMRAKMAECDLKNKQLEKDMQNMCDEKDALSVAHQNAQAEVQVMMACMKTKNKQIQYYQNCEQSWINKDKERLELKNKIETFGQIKKLVQMTESDSKVLLEDVMNGPGALERLVSLCTIIKREYEQCKRNRKSQRVELENVLKQIASMRVTLEEMKTQEKVLKKHCKNSDRELERCEKEIASLKKRLALSESKRHLMSENENNNNNQKKEDIVFSENIDGFLSPSTPSQPQPLLSPPPSSVLAESKSVKNAIVNNCNFDLNDSQSTSFWKITTAAHKKPKLTSKSSMNLLSMPPRDSSPQVPILQNLRRGYDGLGGHTSFTQTLSQASLLKRIKSHKLAFKPRN